MMLTRDDERIIARAIVRGLTVWVFLVGIAALLVWGMIRLYMHCCVFHPIS